MMRHLATLLVMILAPVGWAQTDLTGGQNAKPRVMVIFDNSRSMETKPENDFDSSFFTDDLDSSMLSGNVCDPTNLPNECRNKFCVGKCVMHNVLDPYEELIELGFSTYYHYLRKTQSTLASTGPRTQCQYDVIAGPGENMGLFWSLESNLHEPNQCTISRVGTPAHENSMLEEWGNSLKCQSTSGIPEPPKVCQAINHGSDEWFFNSAGEHSRYSPYMPPPSPGAAASESSLLSPIRPYYNSNGLTGFGVNQVSRYNFAQWGPANGKDYYLFRTSKQELREVRSNACDIGEKRHFWSPPTGQQGGLWYQCTNTNPCWMELVRQNTQWSYTSFYTQPSPPPPGYEYHQTQGPVTHQFFHGSDESLVCPSTMVVTNRGSCTSSNPCTYVEGTKVAYEDTTNWSNSITSSSTQSQTINGVTYQWNGQSSSQTATLEVSGSNGQACPQTYQGLPFVSYSQLPVEPPAVQCLFRSTTYTLVANTSSSVTRYRCDYKLYTYIYRTGENVCVWERTQFDWRPKKWRYRWETVGGEIMASPTIHAVDGENACSSQVANYEASPLGQKCPAVSTTVHPLCGSVPGRYCRLRWRTAQSGFPFARGRGTNYASSSTSSPEPLYCRSADHQNSPTAAPPPWNIKNDWCRYTTHTQNIQYEDVFVMSDPYSPSQGANNQALAVGSTATLGGTVQSVAYSIDGSTWMNQPPLDSKTAGWSRLPKSHSTAPQAAAMSFVPIGPGNETLPLIRKIMEKRTAENPTGLVMPTRRLPHRVTGNLTTVTGLNTPLFGSLTNARDYLVNEVLPNDAQAACRSYSVILVTDGDENQPPNQPQHPGQTFTQYNQGDLVNAVKSLRTLSGSAIKPLNGVKTYVVGFGSNFTAGTLDAMAVAAGTAIDGKAYNASSPETLQLQLKKIFNAITNNRYSRSKPVVSYTKDRMYVGAFRIDGNSLEWSGELNAYALTDVGVNPTPVWEFQDNLNAQSASLRRVFTHLPQTGQININALGGNQASAVYDAMGLSPALGAEVMNFVLNPTLNAPYLNAPDERKSSRLSSVFHSTPVLVGSPPFDRVWAGPDAQDMVGYTQFKAENASRGERMFVGSNTGMLHALCEKTSANNSPNCGNGNQDVAKEVYAFIPPSVLPKLNATRNGHAFTVDGSFGVADVCLNASCDTASKWMTLLVGSMHKGGKSIYALDVTSSDTPNFLWEFTDSTLGETWSPPTVVRANVELATGVFPRWIGLLGGGYLSPGEGNQDVSNSVVVVNLHTGDVLSDKLGTQTPAGIARYRVDSNPATCATQPATCLLPRNSVPSRLAVSRNGESAQVRNAFFGDTQGRVWAMNFYSSLVIDWKPKVLFDASRPECSKDLFGTPIPIFGAEVDPSLGVAHLGNLPFDKVTDPRPIYQRVILARDTDGRPLVFTGTGDANDPSWVGTGTEAKDYDYLYGIRNASTSTVCSGSPMWVKRLRKGEKTLSEGAVGNRVVFMPTYMPPAEDELQNGCGNRGDARIYAFYQSSGSPAKVFDPDLNPATENNTHILELPDEGIISDLLFVADPVDPSKGRIVYATDSGEPRARPVTSLSLPKPAHSWRMVY